jgi:transcriptional regulator with XRE-family HTH domain
MTYELDTAKLATMVRGQRANRTLRDIAAELGDVSASTLHRLEAGKCPDMGVFLRICRWLKVEPSQFFRKSVRENEVSSQSGSAYSQGQIVDLIRSDAILTPVAANILVAIINATYGLPDQQ